VAAQGGSTVFQLTINSTSKCNSYTLETNRRAEQIMKTQYIKAHICVVIAVNYTGSVEHGVELC